MDAIGSGEVEFVCVVVELSADLEWSQFLDVELCTRSAGFDVAPVEPDELTCFIDAGGRVMPVVVFGLTLLCCGEIGC